MEGVGSVDKSRISKDKYVIYLAQHKGLEAQGELVIGRLTKPKVP